MTTAYPAFELDPTAVAADAYVTKNSDLTELKRQIEKCLNPLGTLAEKEIILGKTAQTKAIEPAVQLSLPLNQ